MKSKVTMAAFVAALLTGATGVHAAVCAGINTAGTFTTYSGVDAAPSLAVNVNAAPAICKGALVAATTGAGSESFDGFAGFASSPLNVTFSGAATANGAAITGALMNVVTDTLGNPSGRFDTTNGALLTSDQQKYLEVASTITVTFTNAVGAFGFYATDLGDFGASLLYELYDANGVKKKDGTIFSAVGAASIDGTLLFWGFVEADLATTYKSLKLVYSCSSCDGNLDGVGFDDMFVADRLAGEPNPRVPEPASLALVGLALLGGAAARKFAKR